MAVAFEKVRSTATAESGKNILEVAGLTMHFPLTQGIIFQRQVGAVRAVDGIDFFVEKADTGELYANPKMPYTWGLLRSIPRLDEVRKEKLVPIEGLPPDLISPPPGCKFEPRCQYRKEICHEREPDLIPVPNAKPDHEARCWGTQRVPGGGWLVDLDWQSEIGDMAVLEQIKAEVAQVAAEAERATPGDLPPDVSQKEGI